MLSADPRSDTDRFLAMLRAQREGSSAKSIVALALALDFSSRSVGNWLSGRSVPSPESVQKGLMALSAMKAHGAEDQNADDGGGLAADDLDLAADELDGEPDDSGTGGDEGLKVAGLLGIGADAQRKLSPSLLSLFSSTHSVADLRHRAWGAVVFELAALFDLPLEGAAAAELRATLAGVTPSGQPLQLGQASLRIQKKAQGRGFQRGRIVKLFGALELSGGGERLAVLAALLLTGLAEPGFALAFVYPGGAEGCAQVPLLGPDGAGVSLLRRLVSPALGLPIDAGLQRSEALVRALSFYAFTIAKVLYDGILDRGVQVRIRDDGAANSLFLQLWAKLRGSDEGTTEPLRVVDRCMPVLVPSETGGRIWEQYSHLWFGAPPCAVAEMRVVGRSVATQSRAQPAQAPPLPEQLQRLKAQLSSWDATGVVDRSGFLDTSVRYLQCPLPELDGEWRAGRLSTFAEDLTDYVDDPAARAHLVVLVGPYGTGKTTIAQRVFWSLDERVRGDSSEAAGHRGEGWQALAWDAARQILVPRALFGSDATLQFKQHDLSRVLLQKGAGIALHLSDELRPGARLVINASEMNAVALQGGASGGQAGLEAIEALIREISEKYLPRSLVCFVAMQSASLVSELGDFFGQRPDLVMGRARLDSVWLARGDCLQLELLAPQQTGEDPLKVLLDDRLSDCPTLTAVMARRLSTPLSRRLPILTLQLAKDGDSGVEMFRRFMGELPRGVKASTHVAASSGPIQEYLPAAGRSGLAMALRFGLGTLVSTQIALWNGFQRQFWEMVRNEASLLLRDLAPLAQGGATAARHAVVENLCRSQWIESLPDVGLISVGYSNIDRAVGRRLANATVSAEAFPFKPGAPMEVMPPGGNKPVVINPWLSVVGGTDPLDTGWKLTLRLPRSQEGAEEKEETLLLGVDIVRGSPQQGLNHTLKKSMTEQCCFIDTSTACSPTARVRKVLKNAATPVPRGEVSLLPVRALPQVLAGLMLRFASQWEPSNEPEDGPGVLPRLRAVIDVWVNDHDSPDPEDWTVSRLFIALRERDMMSVEPLLHSETTDATGVGWEDFQQSVNGLLQRFAPRVSGRGVAVWSADLPRQLWRFDRWASRKGDRLGAAEPIEALALGERWRLATAAERADRGSIRADAAGMPLVFLAGKTLRLEVDPTGTVSRTKKLCCQRIYRVRGATEESFSLFGVAVVSWTVSNGGLRFSPYKLKWQTLSAGRLQLKDGGAVQLVDLEPIDNSGVTLYLVGEKPSGWDAKLLPSAELDGDLLIVGLGPV